MANDERFVNAEIDAGTFGEAETHEEAPLPAAEEPSPEPSPEEPEAKAPVQEEPPKPSRLQQRFSELTRARDEARRQTSEALAEVERLRQLMGTQPPPEQSEENEPFRDEVQRMIDTAVAARLAQERERTTRDASIVTAKGLHEDYEETLLGSDLQVAPHVAEVMQSSVNYGELLYYLATHEDEAIALNTLPPMRVALEIGRMEARLSASGRPDPAPPRKQTRAPEPVTPIRGEASSGRDLDSMSLMDYTREMNRRQRESRHGGWR